MFVIDDGRWSIVDGRQQKALPGKPGGRIERQKGELVFSCRLGRCPIQAAKVIHHHFSGRQGN
jgi:hypothetical protein